MARSSRPGFPHTFSQQLSLHRPSRDERRPLLSVSTFPQPPTGSFSLQRSETNPNAATGATHSIPTITLNDSNDENEDEEEHADSDGLYPPNCCYTAAQPRPEGERDRADPFGTKDSQVYLNIHR